MMWNIYFFSGFIRNRGNLVESIGNRPLGWALCFVALSALILVLVPTCAPTLDVKAPDSPLNPGGIARFIINVSNPGETPLDIVAVDALPAGLSYVSDDRGGSALGRNITWTNLGRLDVGGSMRINLVTRIGPCVTGKLENLVVVTGIPPTGYNVTDNDTEDIFVTAPAREPARNIEYINIGNQEAMALSPPGNLGFGRAAVAENYRAISANQR